MSVTHFKLHRFTDGTRIAAASHARAEEMHASGMRDVADIIIDGERPSIRGVVDEDAESCTYYVRDYSHVW